MTDPSAPQPTLVPVKKFRATNGDPMVVVIELEDGRIFEARLNLVLLSVIPTGESEYPPGTILPEGMPNKITNFGFEATMAVDVKARPTK